MNELIVLDTVAELDESMDSWKRMSYHSRVESNGEQFLKNETSNRHFYEALVEFASNIPKGSIRENLLADNDNVLQINKMDYKSMYEEHIRDYVEDVREEIKESSDIVHLLVRKADCLSEKNTVHEAVVIGNIADDIDFKIKNGLVNYDEDIPLVTPFFTPDEMEELRNQEVNPYEYIFGSNQKELHEKLRSTAYEYELEPTDENAEKLIDLGWNPSVPYNVYTIKFARDRIVKWFNENKSLQIIDLSEMVFEEATDDEEVTEVYPVHIVLFRHEKIISKVIRGWTRSEYSHAGLSFDNNLKHIFSYNMRKEDNGFVDESLDQYKKESKGGHLEVVTFFVSSKTRAKLQKTIKFFIDNKSKTKYAFDNILRYVTKHAIDSSKSLNMVCSQFVDFALKSCNIDLTNKPSNLVFPGDFESPGPGTRMFITFKDAVEKFKPQAVANRVRFLLKRPHDELITRTALGEYYAIDQFCKTKNPLYLFTESPDPKVNEILKEIQNCLTAEAIITEAKPSPLRFGKKGDLYIDLPRNLEREYQDAHTLLTSYSETNTSGIKHELARLFYINTLLEQRIQKMKVGDKQYKQCIDLRARVRNDFSRYFKVVSSQEKNFDFEAYYRTTEYYTKTIKVSGDTLKYSGKLIKAFLASQGI